MKPWITLALLAACTNDPYVGLAMTSDPAVRCTNTEYCAAWAVATSFGWTLNIASELQDQDGQCSSIERITPVGDFQIFLSKADLAQPATIPITTDPLTPSSQTAGFTLQDVAYTSGTIMLTQVSGTITGSFSVPNVTGTFSGAPYCPK